MGIDYFVKNPFVKSHLVTYGVLHMAYGGLVSVRIVKVRLGEVRLGETR